MYLYIYLNLSFILSATDAVAAICITQRLGELSPWLSLSDCHTRWATVNPFHSQQNKYFVPRQLSPLTPRTIRWLSEC